VAIARQNLFCSSRPATGGRPGDGNEARPDRTDRRLAIFIATSNFRVLRRPFECKPGIPCAMVLTVYFALSPVTGYRMHTSLLQKSAGTDSLVGIGLAEGDAMSMEVGLGRFGDRRLEKGGRHCMRRSFDGLVHAFGALPGTERRRFGSRVFYAMKG
jgi:hypothetical protein